MVLGSSTDTYDATGEITAEVQSFDVTQRQIIEVLEGFKGEFLQTPPMYSALHHKGKRLYELARAGIEVERPPRSVKVLSLKLVKFEESELVLDVECSHGFYARALANDIGEKLGTHAHMSGLIRTHAGPFKLEDTVSIEDVIEIADSGDWRDLLMPIDTTLRHYGSVNLDTSLVEMVRHGRSLPISTFGEDGAHMPGERIRAYTPAGELLAILIFEPDRLRWRPEKVLAGL
jgi:tRNA pseudouridine55 synthase